MTTLFVSFIGSLKIVSVANELDFFSWLVLELFNECVLSEGVVTLLSLFLYELII